MLPRIQIDNTTGRFYRRHDPRRADAAFADAFGEAQQDHLGHESDINVEDQLRLSNEFPTDPALFTDHIITMTMAQQPTYVTTIHRMAK
jgi:hypothetical protein